jgi:hypothetical protein
LVILFAFPLRERIEKVPSGFITGLADPRSFFSLRLLVLK